MLDLGHLNSTDWGHADVDMKKKHGGCGCYGMDGE
jgi:hypothetical protein